MKYQEMYRSLVRMKKEVTKSRECMNDESKTNDKETQERGNED